MKSRPLGRIRVTIGATVETFLLSNETLASRNEAIRRMRELRMTLQRNVLTTTQENPPQSDVNEHPQSIPSPEPGNPSVSLPLPTVPQESLGDFEFSDQDQYIDDFNDDCLDDRIAFFVS
jgi:hypothetical protein